MKKLLAVLFLFSSFAINAQDVTPIVVNLSDNLALQFKGSLVKMKAVVKDFRPIINGTKDFYIAVTIQYYENNAGAYGPKITDTILNDVVLTNDQKLSLLAIYGDRAFEYQTTGKWVNGSGDVVPAGTGGAITEMAYWQNFKLNQVSGMAATTALQGALDAQYLIIAAIVTKLNTRKSW